MKALILPFLLLVTSCAADHYSPSTQETILSGQLQSLKPEKAGVRDLYFVGVAPYSTEDVFMNETNYVRNLFDRRYRTRGRSLFLVNNLKTLDQYPLATVSNMQKAFQKIGSSINSDEDIVVLFITSHGDYGKGIRLKSEGIDNLELSREYLDAGTIRHLFDDNEIRWRIIILSACFSGGLIDTLKDEYTLIITSASEDNPSFGCGHHGAFTQFGETYFKDNLSHNSDFISAFESAKVTIKQLESELDIGTSNPQLFVGEKIRPLLENLGR